MHSSPSDEIDTREFVFPLITIVIKNDLAQKRTMKFLGTAFFVAKNGVAVTAAHVIPREIESDRILAAALFVDGKENIYPIEDVLRLDEFDFALLSVQCPPTKYLPIAMPRLLMGTDVEILGIPDHTTTDDGTKQMRLLKGHIVTLDSKKFEVNFPVPAGMSGSPVLVDDHVVGYATGRVRSEELEDLYEEIEEISNNVEKITIIKSHRVTLYGVGHPFQQIMNLTLTALEDQTLAQFLAIQNERP